jgi:HK97 family phage major capsid protein
MEIQTFLDSKTLVPVSELASIAANRSAFGEDVVNAFSRQIELRSTAAQTVLTDAEKANRDTLLASEQRSYDANIRERDSLLSLQQAVERRTAEKGFVPATQGGTTKPETRGGIFGSGVELRALVTTGSAGAVIAPDQFGPGFFDRLAPQSVMLKAGIQTLRIERDTVKIPRVDTDPAAVFVAEGIAITPADPGYTEITASPVKIATLTVISNELAMDSSPDVVQLLEMQMLRSLALKFDLACLTANETNFKGLQFVTGITLDSSLGATGLLPTNLDVIAGAISTLETEGAHASAIIMHPRSWGSLLKIKEITGSTKSLMQEAATAAAPMIFGVPVYLTSQLSITETKGASTDCSSIYVIDGSQIYGVFRTDARVEVDHSRLFNSDQSEVRAIMRATLAVPNAKAVVRIEGVRAV